MNDVREMMTCQELVELVTDYLEGRLDGRQRARFEEHLGECPPCDSYLEQMRETVGALGRIPPESLSPEAERTLLAAFHGWAARTSRSPGR
ncbi:MAG TPA: zf-HC2 domain-containing protein [Solirubrobacterales bacterium]|nr:zf-HC2 domain-containing protein [Solirubrobacterales bacterium]